VIGSATKSITALAVMRLVDSGKVTLETSVRDLVPELSLAAGEDVDAITVRHLLQQTTGLDDLASGPLLASAADGTPVEAVAELRDARLASPPGETWRYANVNYVLAGLVVERASGLSYADYVDQRIFTPLGMNDSIVAGQPTDASTGHKFWFGIPMPAGPTVRQAEMAAGYIISTAEDLSRYLTMYLSEGRASDGTPVVSAAGIKTMLTPGPEAKLGPWANGMKARYAMGWFVGGPWGANAIFHPGNSPDSSAMLALFPKKPIAVATLTNAGHELPVPGNPALTDSISRNVIFAALEEPVPAPPSLTNLYVLFDLVSMLLVVLAIRGVQHASTDWRRRQPPAHRQLAVVGVLVRLLGVTLLVLTPALLIGWGWTWTWAPDLALVLAGLAVLLAVAMTLRLALLLHRKADLTAPHDDQILRYTGLDGVTPTR
jgi:CubicO group peptidase (beta-lactamase class C family)